MKAFSAIQRILFSLMLVHFTMFAYSQSEKDAPEAFVDVNSILDTLDMSTTYRITLINDSSFLGKIVDRESDQVMIQSSNDDPLPIQIENLKNIEQMDNSSLNIIELLLNISVAIIMLGMGLSLTIADFIRIKEEPKAVALGLVNQLILLPLIGFGLVLALGLEGQYAVGLMLIAACPGGATSNLISNLAKGDIGLSVTLTAFSSVITVLTIPFIVNFALVQFMDSNTVVLLPYAQIFVKILLITVVPVALGMFIRAHAEAFAMKMENPVKIASVVLMTSIIIGAVAINFDKLSTALPIIGPAVVSLNIITMLLGFFSGKLLRLNIKQQVSISIECGIQNGSLALAIVGMALTQYKELALVPATYGVLMFAIGGIFAGYYARLVTKSEQQENA